MKFTPFSQKLYRLTNHSMCTLSDGENYEKTFIFGGIAHSIKNKKNDATNEELYMPKFK